MQVQATNMTAAILVALSEEPGNRRDDGALALITAMFADDDKSKDTKQLRDILSSQFSRRPGFTVKEFPLTGANRTGVFMKCAEIVLDWYEKFICCRGQNRVVVSGRRPRW